MSPRQHEDGALGAGCDTVEDLGSEVYVLCGYGSMGGSKEWVRKMEELPPWPVHASNRCRIHATVRDLHNQIDDGPSMIECGIETTRRFDCHCRAELRAIGIRRVSIQRGSRDHGRSIAVADVSARLLSHARSASRRAQCNRDIPFPPLCALPHTVLVNASAATTPHH
jgi:hypothetical protein